MIKKILFSFFVFTGLLQGQSIDWLRSYGGSNSEAAGSLAQDASGNLLLTGNYRLTTDFGNQSLVSNGESDVFILKNDSLGNPIWLKSIGGSASDGALAIATDNQNNVFIGGYFIGTVDFDPGPGLSNHTATVIDMFILKLDSNGNYLWSRTIGGSSLDFVSDIAVDQAGNVYCTGVFEGTVDFDPGSGQQFLYGSGGRDVFTLKLDAAGNYIWAKSFGSFFSDESRSIALDQQANVYFAGNFQGTVDFDPSSAQFNLSSTSLSIDAFVAKLDSAGNFIWAKSSGGPSLDYGDALAVDPMGNAYLTGRFQDTADFDPGSNYYPLISKNASSDIFVQKLDSNGNFRWAKGLGSSAFDVAEDIELGSFDELYLTGLYSDDMDFNPDLGVDSVMHKGGGDAFILKLDSAGNYFWAYGFGASRADRGAAIVTTGNDFYYLGTFMDTVDFNPSLGIDTAISRGGQDISLFRWKDCSTYMLTDSVIACGPYTWIDGLTYNTSDSSATYIINNGSGACDSIINLFLTIKPSIDNSIQVNANTLTANNVNASYQWVDCANNFMPLIGENARSFTATQNGTYAVIVSENACVDTSSCFTINNISLGEEMGLGDFDISPNPTSGWLKVEVPEQWRESELLLTNSVGEVIIRVKATNLKENLLYWEAPAGLYFLNFIRAGEESKSFKIIRH